MNRAIQMFLAAALLLVAVPRAYAAPPFASGDVTFQTVDSVQYIGTRELAVRGIPVNQTQAQEFIFYFYNDQVAVNECHKQAILAMERPGRYLLSLEPVLSNGYGCKLTRR